ncbi:MAG: hypothetical protein GWO41_16980 [candidate division Zixibacteria bacterium]|nr:hypothetical protein [candidate division Zixibacteria bacterium]NIQ91835.1 hypothetical protein [Deltaproteobacteria bacterium]NIR68247.1 hypothetical protein [candidate division Zixibacteria bacterium]NIS49417.1 hypothetical protein [candidate division Zixibacteria bacterium]NIT54386.1 hypothetical protein [candidate division Zixibacteria bacterium]
MKEVTIYGRRFKSRLQWLGLTVEEALSEAENKAFTRSEDAKRNNNPEEANQHLRWSEQINRFGAKNVGSALRSKSPRLLTLCKLAAIAQTSVAWLVGDIDDQEYESDYSWTTKGD